MPYLLLGTLHSKAAIVDILDKGKGANILIDSKLVVYTDLMLQVALSTVVTSDENDEIVCKNQFSLYVIGLTGFGGKRRSSFEKVHTLIKN